MKFDGDDINEYIDERVSAVTHDESEWRMVRHDKTRPRLGELARQVLTFTYPSLIS
jgi:hypothetical protein